MAPAAAWGEVEEEATDSQPAVTHVLAPTLPILSAVLGEVEELVTPADLRPASPPSTSSIHHPAAGGQATLPEVTDAIPAPLSLAGGLARRRSRLKLQL